MSEPFTARITVEPTTTEPTTTDEMWDTLIDWGVSKQTLEIVVCINGYSTDTMKEVLYAYCGYRNFGQAIEEEGV